MNIDEKYMCMAIELAKKAEGQTSPNPLVGALVVKGGRIVGKGYHKRAGLPHAEMSALSEAGERARGAILYVTLEPCDHFGRTPPCTDVIIKKGIKKAIIGMYDPNPRNRGRGIKRLNKNGVKTEVGVLEERARSINRPYIKFITRKFPYVTVKLAQSLDGKIATRTGDSKWISTPQSRAYVQTLRSKVDAILVGLNTILKDDPLLTPRGPGLYGQWSESKRPVRIIVDTRLRTPMNARIFSTIDKFPLIITTTDQAPLTKIALYRDRGAEILVVKSSENGVDMKDLFSKLAERHIMHVLAEGGGSVVASLLDEGLVDRMLLFVAPKIIGGRDAIPSVGGRGVNLVRDALRVKDMEIKRLKKDILIEAYL